jgi:hypothetical protein
MGKERYKFVRDGCFDKLTDYFEASDLEIKIKDITYPTEKLQLSLPGFNRGYGLRVRLGRFFEILAQGIYGGKIGDFYELSELNGQNIKRTEPDITHQKINILREVKATHIRNSLKLIDEQMDNYFSLQFKKLHSKPPLIRFEIFRHNLKGLLGYESQLEGMISKLAEGTRAMISLPFSVMYRIYKAGIPFTGRYKGETFDNSTLFHASGLNYLLAEPEETLEKLKIDLEFFEFEKRRFPDDVTVNERKIVPFPVLIITEKDPEKLRFLRKIIAEEDIPF